MSATISCNGYAYPTPAAFVKAGCYLEKESNIDNDLLMQMFPARYEPNADMIVYQHQNIFCGVQQWRGIGNQLPTAQFEEVYRECAVMPGYWGEELYLDEQDLTRRAVRNPPNGCATAVDISDLVARRQNLLMKRRHNLLRKLVADTLVFGAYEAIDQRTGAVVARQKYNINETTASIPWSDKANSTPFLDLLNWRNYYESQTMFKFGCCAKAVMNRNTYNKLMTNVNPANYRALSGEYCCQGKTLGQINDLLCSHDLPQITVYNETYFDCDVTRGPIFANGGGGNKKFFIPDNWVIIVGCTDTTIGNMWYTRNVNTCSDVPEAGPVTMVIDQCDRPPRKISVMDYWNGGPALECPKAIISAMV